MFINVLMAIVFFLVYSTFVFYIGWNIWVWLKEIFEVKKKWPLAIIMLFLGYSFVLMRFLEESIFIKIVGSYWMGVLQYSIILLPIVNLVTLILKKYTKKTFTTIVKWSGIATLSAFVLIFAIGTYNAYTPTVRSYEVAVDKAVKGKEQIRIVFTSDMHFGVLSGKNHGKRMVEEINQLNPDVVMFGGDIIDDDPTPFIEKKIDKDISQIKAPLGVYAILGNHENYGGKIPEFVEKMEEIDVKVLRDHSVELENNIILVGRKDYSDKKRKPLEELVSNLNKNKPLLLLDHQPNALVEAENNGVDIVMSGHTHRGQMAPNHLITGMLFENDWGYLKKGSMHSIVSSGFGFWGPPLRLGSQSEVVVIDVKFK